MRAVMWLESMHKVSIPSLSCCYVFVCCSAGLKSGSIVKQRRVEESQKLLPHSTGHQLMEKHLCKVESSMLLPACLLLLANKQQVEMSSRCTLNCFSLPVSRSRNGGNWEEVQYISMSSGIYSSWICSRVSKSMEQLLYCCSYIWANYFIIC